MQKQIEKKRILWIVLVVVIAAVSAVTFWNMYKMADSRKDANAKGIVISDEAEDWDGSLTDLSGGQQGIKIPGYGDLTVKAGTDTWDIALVNPEGNQCYFQYSITIDDGETPIYQSDLIEPGKAIEKFQVTEELEQGDYEIHLNISTYSMDEELAPMNGADVKSVLHVI